MKERVKLSRRRGFTRLSGKRQITLPLGIVEELGLLPGDELRVTADGDRIVLSREEGLAERGYRLVFNTGRDASNTVPHLHLHMLGGRPMAWPPG